MVLSRHDFNVDSCDGCNCASTIPIISLLKCIWMCMVDFVHDFAYHLSLASLLHAKSLTANEYMRVRVTLFLTAQPSSYICLI